MNENVNTKLAKSDNHYSASYKSKINLKVRWSVSQHKTKTHKLIVNKNKIDIKVKIQVRNDRMGL